MSGNDATSEVYAKLLLLERLGYPLWYPDLPLDQNLPQAYREDGVCIGDVGKITGEGTFEFKFNVCADAGEPMNARGISDHFERWAIVPEDKFYFPAMLPPETVIKGGLIIEKRIHSQGMIEPSEDRSLDVGVEFASLSPKGAILILPDGASKEDLHEYAKEDFYNRLTDDVVLQWLDFAKTSSLSLVTGWVKSRSWGVAIVCNDESTPLTFSAVKTGSELSDLYRWEGGIPGHSREGPSTPGDSENQCVFLRGFKMTSRRSWKRDTVATNIGDGKTQTKGRKSGSETGFDESDHKMLIEPLSSTTPPRHPSDVINEYLLEKCPEARVAITHDDDWLTLIDEGDEQFLHDDALLSRACLKYKPVLQSGCARFVVREKLQADGPPSSATSSFSGTQVSNHVDVLWLLLSRLQASDTSADSRSTRDLTASKPALPIPVADTSPPLFALLIGINCYKDPKVHTLKGAVSDADAMQEYLEYDLKVPKSRIRNLRDTQATRAAIISELRALAVNSDINPNDPILVYYAGHGAEVTPPVGWEAGGAGSKTQMLIPHDYHTTVDNCEVYGIPDRSIAVLLDRIAKKKGDNITVILDCCHSGSGTRTDVTDHTHLIRGFDIMDPVPAELDQHIWGDLSRGRGTDISPGFLHTGLRSHVLLTACGAKERAKEKNGRGAFTKAVLDVLNTVSANTVTYADVLQRMHPLPGQNPQCEGVHRGRILFNAMVPSIDRVFYKLHEEQDKYVLDAGAAHGINEGAEFAIYEGQESPSKTSALGVLIVGETRAFSAIMNLPDNAPRFELTGTGYALQTKTGEEEDLRLHIPLNDKLTPIFEALGIGMVCPSPDRRKIVLVEKAKAELDIAIDGDRVVFNILNSQVTQFGLNQMPYRIKPTYDDIYRVIRASAHYHWHLRRNRRRNTSRNFQDHVHLEFMKLEELDDYDDDLNPIVKPVGDNLNVEGVVDLVVNTDDLYGIKLVNNSAHDLYPSLFYFDNSDLSILSYYQPPTSAQKLDVPLHRRINDTPGSLCIGYGSGGSPPFSYFLREGQDVDVGFLKLFLTTEPVDYSTIPQPSPFTYDDRKGELSTPKACSTHPIWDTILLAVVQRRVPLLS